jgi:glutamine cyclotransferase
MMRMPFALTFLGLAACAQPVAQQVQAPAGIPTYGYRIAATYPHDPGAFTQGLFWLDGSLYESTGHVGQSTLRRVNLEDGRVLQRIDIPRVFGEGSVNWGNEIISITWQDGVGYRWDRATFRQLGTFTYPGEGWGLTQNGSEIIMSDGTAELRFLDPATMQERRRITVTADGERVANLNELEWVNGEIFANVWQTPRIARIDPATGNVTGWIDLGQLAAQHEQGDPDRVLNGIAYDAARDRLFVTGKYWNRLYEIDLSPPAGR